MRMNVYVAGLHGATIVVNLIFIWAIMQAFGDDAPPSGDDRQAVALIAFWMALNLASAIVAAVRETSE